MLRSESHLDALAATIRACPALQIPESAALVMLARTLASQMDSAAGEPSTRLSAAYLSCLKDVHRVVASTSTSSNPGATAKRAKLEALRRGATV